MKYFITLLLAVILISFSGVKDENVPFVETIDGVEYVHNTAVPRYPERTLELEEELCIGDEENDELKVFKMGWCDIDDSGTLFIVDDSEQDIKVYDRDGKYIKTIGRKGQGPGEFGRIACIKILNNGNIIVSESRLRRLNVFSSEGEFI